MKPLKLVVYFDQLVTAGGGYQQSLNAVKLVEDLPSDIVDIVVFACNKDSYEKLSSMLRCTVLYTPLSIFSKTFPGNLDELVLACKNIPVCIYLN